MVSISAPSIATQRTAGRHAMLLTTDVLAPTLIMASATNHGFCPTLQADIQYYSYTIGRVHIVALSGEGGRFASVNTTEVKHKFYSVFYIGFFFSRIHDVAGIEACRTSDVISVMEGLWLFLLGLKPVVHLTSSV